MGTIFAHSGAPLAVVTLSYLVGIVLLMDETHTTTTIEHRWVQTGADSVHCANCDARYGGRWHDLPCGSTDSE